MAQRICLYLARISPQQTIDHLVYEVSLGLHEDYSATETSFVAGEAGGGAVVMWRTGGLVLCCVGWTDSTVRRAAPACTWGPRKKRVELT